MATPPPLGWRPHPSASGQYSTWAARGRASGAVVPVRDSKAAPYGPVLTFAAASWGAFVSEVKGGPVR
ncbi:DUF397 domain-containing protein [Streptomyces evansiae]|uniref:DUF397 domain-containing protein n=1 Tax=Streptomyces evansiae TaxID=3075535 RepID=UPI0037D9F37E